MTSPVATAPLVSTRAPAQTSTIAQTWALSMRSIQSLLRQPSLVIPSLIFPLFFAALGTSSF